MTPNRTAVRLALALTLSLALAACGGDSSTGPQNANIAGTWRFSWTNMAGSVQGIPYSCNVSVADFVITQSGSGFSGVQQGNALMLCFVLGETTEDLFGGETIVGGSVNGSQVSFRLGTLEGQHSGTTAGTSISGSAQWRIVVEGVSVNFAGAFTAVRI